MQWQGDELFKRRAGPRSPGLLSSLLSFVGHTFHIRYEFLDLWLFSAVGWGGGYTNVGAQ